MLNYGIGYKQLTPSEQEAYKVILQGFANYVTSFDASKLPKEIDIMHIIQTVVGDHPEIVYFNKTQLRITKSLFKKQISLIDCSNKSKTARMNDDLKTKLVIACSEIKSKCTDEFELLKGISEYIQNHVKYDFDELNACIGGRSQRPESHNAYGALINGYAVCDGIAGAFALIAQKLGFECMIVQGKSTIHDGKFTEHGWNIVKYGNKHYHIDVTWDMNKYSQFQEYSYEYFGIDDDAIMNDHDWNINYTPTCNSNELSYYYKNNKYANNQTQLDEIFLKDIRNGETIIQVKLSYNISLPSDPNSYLGQKVIDIASNMGKSTRVSYIWNEGMRCFTAKVTY